jgi:hypothetical protein
MTELIKVPLTVDLDGTLILKDSVAIAFFQLLRQHPLRALVALLKLTQGKPAYKTYLAKHVVLDVTTLPYNQPLITWLKEQKLLGRTLILATASDEKFAQPIADYVGLFSDCMASNAHTHLKGVHKRDALNARFGVGKYDYVGNHSADYPIWRDTHAAIVTNAKASVVRKARQISNVIKVI